MFFLRWVVGYPILIILLVTAVYALYNQDNLKHWFNKNDPVEVTGHSENGNASAGETATTTVSDTQHHVVAIHEGSSAAVNAESQPDSEEDSGFWANLFKRNPPADNAAMHTAKTDATATSTTATNVEIEVTVEADADVKTEEKASNSWLGMFKRKKPEMEQEENVVVTENEVQTTEAVNATVDAVTEEEEEQTSSWLDVFKNSKTEESESTAEISTDVADAAGSVADAAETVIAEVEKESGSWLDVFKRSDTEKAESGAEEAVTDADETAASATDEAATATSEVEKESGSWLDIFKRKKPENDDVAADQVETATDKTDIIEDKSGKVAEAAVAEAGDRMQLHESLRLARMAYWNRDFDAAFAIYDNMTKADPENVDLLGEYGNFLYQAGRIPQAMDIFEKVARQLISHNRIMEVGPLIRFIGSHDRERAQKLEQSINTY